MLHQVGLLETREQAERKSGVEAWSLRLHSHLTELNFSEFTARFEGQDIPFHRVVFFKQNGAVVWESENLLRKAGDHHTHPNLSYGGLSHNSSCSRADLPAVPVLSGFHAGCSPPANSFMARIAAATPGAPTGLPPRATSSCIPDYSSSSSFTTGCSSSKPHRHSVTDYSSSPHSWSGAGHFSAVAGIGSMSGTPSLSPLGSSPAGSAICTSAPALYGCSPRLTGSWTGSITPGVPPGGHSRGNSFTISPSPGASCSSSWTGTSPLAAAVAGGMVSLLHSRAVIIGESASTAVEEHLQEQSTLLQQPQEEENILADYSQLPEECWLLILQQLGVKELCIISRISRALKVLAARSFLWSTAYERLFGSAPPGEWSGPTVKRLCRRSELRASRWLDADVEGHPAGFTGTWCCQLDDSKVVSGDGSAVRLWSHDTGRRIATLRGHTGRVTSVTFDDEIILSGCSQATVKLWSMDELKLSKTLRHHTGPISATLLLHGMPISASKDGSICVWDAAAPNTPLVVVEAGSPVHALELQEEKGHLLCASSTLAVYDMNTTQLLYSLQPPAGSSRFSRSSRSSSSSSSSSSSVGDLAPAAAATGVLPAVATAAAAAAVGEVHALDEDLDADLLDGVLLQDFWLDDDSESSSDEVDDEDGGLAAAGAGVGAGQGVAAHSSSGGKPFTSISCYGNLVAAGRPGSVVLWDLRSQDPVGFLTPPTHNNCCNTPCVGVQLDDWKLATGWAAGSVGGAAGSSTCWWQSNADVAGATESWGSAAHSLELYDIRAAASFSNCDPASSGDCNQAPWASIPVMTLPVPNRITCFQYHNQNLLVGQEGADCCLIKFNPPGTNIAKAAAAWGYAGSSSGHSRAVAGSTFYGASPGATGHEDGVCSSEGPCGRGKGKKKGGAKVPAKKQTRYPKRATR